MKQYDFRAASAASAASANRKRKTIKFNSNPRTRFKTQSSKGFDVDRPPYNILRGSDNIFERYFERFR